MNIKIYEKRTIDRVEFKRGENQCLSKALRINQSTRFSQRNETSAPAHFFKICIYRIGRTKS